MSRSSQDMAKAKGMSAEGMHGGAELVLGIISSVLSCSVARSAIIIIISLCELDFYDSRYHRLFFTYRSY